jgi:hypothetical protein
MCGAVGEGEKGQEGGGGGDVGVDSRAQTDVARVPERLLRTKNHVKVRRHQWSAQLNDVCRYLRMA